MMNHIKELRIRNKLSQSEFGMLFGVSDKAVSTWENGIKMPRYKTLQKIANHFSIPMEWLLEDYYQEALIDKYNSVDPELLEKYNGDLDAAYEEQTRQDRKLARSFINDFISKKDTEFLNEYLKLNETGKDKATEYVKDLSSMEKYRK